MAIVLVFCTHGIANGLMMSGLNPLRCAFWNLTACSADQAWMYNWLSLSHLQVFLLLSCLAYSAFGSLFLEQRLLSLCCALMLVQLSTGVFMIDELHPPLACLQVIVLGSLLAASASYVGNSTAVAVFPSQLKSSSFDHRRQLAIPTMVVAVQFLLSAIRVFDMTFGSGRSTYTGDPSTVVYQAISGAALCNMLWVCIILGWSIMLTPVEQQKKLLMGQTLSLFASLVMLAGEQGAMIEEKQQRAAVVGTFVAIIVAMLGAY